MTSRHSYDAADLTRAEWGIALRGGLQQASSRPLLLALIEIADGLIAGLNGRDGQPDKTAGPLDVSAFSYGFLIAASLRGQELSTVRPELLPDALTGVATRGRHAIIAADCDLQAFAEIQLRTTRDLAACATDRDPAAAESQPPPQLERVFESGFALGLLLCETSTETPTPASCLGSDGLVARAKPERRAGHGDHAFALLADARHDPRLRPIEAKPKLAQATLQILPPEREDR